MFLKIQVQDGRLAAKKDLDLKPLPKILFLGHFALKNSSSIMYLPMSLFHAGTAGLISTKFCTDLPANSGKVLNTSMTPSTQPLDPRLPQTPKPKQVTGEKTLCNVKCPDG